MPRKTPLFYLLIFISLLLVAWLDFITGPDLSFFVFYFAPISVTAWYRGRAAGICLAIVSIGAWFVVTSASPIPSMFVFFWNAGVRFVAFIIIAIAMARIGGEMRRLRQLLPICAWCKKIRDDKGYWEQVETYFQKHANTQFTHGACPECAAKLFEHHPE